MLRHKICHMLPENRSGSENRDRIIGRRAACHLWVYGRVADPTDRTPVPSLDLACYMGSWQEVARYDHPFERGLAERRGYRTDRLLFVDQGQ